MTTLAAFLSEQESLREYYSRGRYTTREPVQDAVCLIAAERKRQIEDEGWTPEHDDQHGDGEMLTAAVIYYQSSGALKILGEPVPLAMRADGAPLGWPWDAEWWRPKSPKRDLVRAGALCLAERERLRRKKAWFGHVDQKLDLIIAALSAVLQSETGSAP